MEPCLEFIEKNTTLRLKIVEMMSTYAGDMTWSESVTKLHIFNLTEYKRIVYLDSDALVMRNLDHLFQLPPHFLYAPRYIELFVLDLTNSERIGSENTTKSSPHC